MISKSKALQIAEKHHGPGFKLYRITSGTPDNVNLYSAYKNVWCVLCSSHPNDGKIMLCSSRAIIISKEKGKILYDGSAHDEG